MNWMKRVAVAVLALVIVATMLGGVHGLLRLVTRPAFSPVAHQQAAICENSLARNYRQRKPAQSLPVDCRRPLRTDPG